jgi:hypothetical protein
VLALWANGTPAPDGVVFAGVVLTGICASFVFVQEKLVFDRQCRTVTHVTSAWRRRVWRFEDAQSLEFVTVGEDFQECNVVFQDGSRLVVCRGAPRACRAVGQRVASFLDVPRGDGRPPAPDSGGGAC